MRGMQGTVAVTLATVVGALLGGPASAHAATVTYNAEQRFGLDNITYQADPGERNQLRLYHDSPVHERLRMVNLTDGTNVILPAASPGPEGELLPTLTQCVVAPITAAYCRFRDVTNVHNAFGVQAFLGDGNDLGRVSYVAHPGYRLQFGFDGGTGNDHLLGSPERDFFTGGPGADRIDAGAGDDIVSARDGEADTVDCGPGADIVEFADPVDQLSGCEDVRF